MWYKVYPADRPVLLALNSSANTIMLLTSSAPYGGINLTYGRDVKRYFGLQKHNKCHLRWRYHYKFDTIVSIVQGCIKEA